MCIQNLEGHRSAIKKANLRISTFTMKIVCIGMLLCLCLVSSQARPGIRRLKQEGFDESEVQNQISAKISHFGKCTN